VAAEPPAAAHSHAAATAPAGWITEACAGADGTPTSIIPASASPTKVFFISRSPHDVAAAGAARKIDGCAASSTDTWPDRDAGSIVRPMVRFANRDARLRERE